MSADQRIFDMTDKSGQVLEAGDVVRMGTDIAVVGQQGISPDHPDHLIRLEFFMVSGRTTGQRPWYTQSQIEQHVVKINAEEINSRYPELKPRIEWAVNQQFSRLALLRHRGGRHVPPHGACAL